MAPATGCWPGCRWHSTPRVRRCGWRGGTAPAWCPRRARWCAAVWTSGPWLVTRDVTVVSTVPTLAALWPAEALEAVRLLIFGGEACPPELAERLAGLDGREVWNTYGPTEATVVACAAKLDGSGPISIGLPLPGWDLAVVDADGQQVGYGETGELVIGGVGLARYLDEDKDAEKYAPMPTLGWKPGLSQRRSGAAGRRRAVLLRPRRRPGQGRGPAHRTRRGGLCAGASARGQRRRGRGPAHRRRHPGAGRLRRQRRPGVRYHQARATRWPGSYPPRWCHGWSASTSCPPARRARSTATRCRGRRPAAETDEPADLAGTAGWLAGLWRDLLGAAVDGPQADFFALGGGSLAAAQLVAALRQQYPQVTVADLYDHPRLGSLAGFLDELDPPPAGRRAGGAADSAPDPGPRRLLLRCRWRRCRHCSGLPGWRWATTLPALCIWCRGRGGELVAGRGGVRPVRHAAGPDGHRGAVRPPAAAT